jgi:hypothetical protein
MYGKIIKYQLILIKVLLYCIAIHFYELSLGNTQLCYFS